MLIKDLPAIPTFSFRLNGVPSAAFLSAWGLSATLETTPGGTIEHFHWNDPQGGLRLTAHLRRFSDFPALDWFLELENQGAEDTPLIEELLPLDLPLPVPAKDRLRLH